jgi:hypothetical protein
VIDNGKQHIASRTGGQRLLFSNQAFVIFVFLQALDVLTTMLGLRLGAEEGSFFIARIMKFGTLPALLMAKAISIVLVMAVVAFGRRRLLQKLNLWYAGLVTWNLIMIFLASNM